jgi:hypothetical protein
LIRSPHFDSAARLCGGENAKCCAEKTGGNELYIKCIHFSNIWIFSSEKSRLNGCSRLEWRQLHGDYHRFVASNAPSFVHLVQIGFAEYVLVAQVYPAQYAISF